MSARGRAFRLSHDGRRILTTSSDQIACIWDAHGETMSVQHLLAQACARQLV